jgi:CO/xanthine dehydrogenase Mo-binding subunit
LKEEIILDGGAYAELSPRVCFRAATHAAGPYRIPNVYIDAKAVYTNKVPTGAFRGFSKPQITFAAELQMDELAGKLGMDPIDLRLKNMIDEGDVNILGQKMTSVGVKDCVLKAREISGWDKKRRDYQATSKEGKVRGIGMAVNEHAISVGILSPDVGSAIVEVDKHGNIIIKVAIVEIGQGTSTALAKLASEYLSVPLNKIKVLQPDTKIMYDSGTTTASRGTVVGGIALRKACEKLKALLLEKASNELYRPASEIKFEEGVFKAGDLELTLEELASRCYYRGEKLSVEEWIDMHEGLSWDFEKGSGSPFPCYSYGAHVAEVELDVETGSLKIINYYAVHDAGKIINIVTSRDQIIGGIVQGIGYALMENLIIENGRIQNPTFRDYYIPTSLDIPERIKVEFVETHLWDRGPSGAKGLAEIGLNPVAAAIGNALFHATNIVIRELPFTPEKILSYIKGGVK